MGCVMCNFVAGFGGYDSAMAIDYSFRLIVEAHLHNFQRVVLSLAVGAEPDISRQAQEVDLQ